jgi:3-methyladenine DNA glycosylase AlkD
MNDLKKLIKELSRTADKKRAKNLQWFFKTGPGEYGAGDVFLGIILPKQRQIAKKYPSLGLKEVKRLLDSKIHEFRLVGLLILIDQYQKASTLKIKEKIVKFYLKNSQRINNWDLVDLSVYKILGDWLLTHQGQKNILDRLVVSKNLWERRMAMIATYAFIRQGSSTETLKIAKKLLNDKEDLIHKAVGWMLREVGRRVSRETLLKFLEEYAKRMPRTALRYALEHLPERSRQYYLKK